MLTLNLTDSFAEALSFAFRVHARQLRKGSRVPYMSHLMAVCSLVMEHGGSQEEAIAALLHDSMEDQGVRYEEISGRFGNRVADIVQGCTHPKLNWKEIPAEDVPKVLREQRLRYFEHLRSSFSAIQLVSACDKLHNARHILHDLAMGKDVMKFMRGGRTGTLWYYKQLVDVFNEVGPRMPALELAHTVNRIEAMLKVVPEGAGV